MKRTAIILILVILTAGMGVNQVHAAADSDSVIIGRLTGTRQPLPGYFYQSTYLANQAIPVMDVEFSGYRLIREADGKAIKFRPNSREYFYKQVQPGKYTLARLRKDRPIHGDDKILRILSFEVKPDSLINLGTLDIVVLDKPKEILYGTGRYMEGFYTYHYSYKRSEKDRSYENPLYWFRDKKKAISDRYEGQIFEIQQSPEGELDSSKVVLREVHEHSN